MSGNEIVLVGYSGHGLVVAEAAFESGLPITSYTDKIEKEINPFQLKYLGFESDLHIGFWEKPYDFILGIGSNSIREKVAAFIPSRGKTILNVIHPSACISKFLTFGSGNFFSRNVSINAFVEIGSNCILNTACIIEHECRIGNNVHIGPGAVLAGNVIIGNNAFIGANAVIKNGVKVGPHALIGAGAVIIKDVPDNKKIAGNPGKEI